METRTNNTPEGLATRMLFKFLFFVQLLTSGLHAQTNDGYAVNWHWIGGGGGISSDGTYALSGIIGQSDVGVLTSTDGYQVVGGYGQTFAPVPDFLFGQQITPTVALGVDMSKVPGITPPQKAFYVNGAQKVYANEPGYVTITWTLTNGSTQAMTYLIGALPARPPVSLYFTDLEGTPWYYTNNILLLQHNPVNPMLPLVDLSGVAYVIIHTNYNIPNNPADLTLVKFNNNLYAKRNTGLIVLEYRDAGSNFLDIEIVQVKANIPDYAATTVDIGDQLQPAVPYTNAAKPSVSRGGIFGSPPTAQSFVYQHPSLGPQYGNVYAIQKALTDQNIEVYWERTNVQGVVWPYEMHRYLAGWPSSPSKFQRYVRDAGQVHGPDVIIPSANNCQLMPFQEPAGNATFSAPSFITTNAGWSLLQYLPGTAVSFQVVLSVLHNDPTQYNLNPTNWAIGGEITEPTHVGPRPGYIHAPEGNRYDSEIYDGNTNTFPTKQIFGVNTGILEVWWANTNQSVQWPSLVKRYNMVWPLSPESITLGGPNGTGFIDPNVYVNWKIYIQNDPAQAGFNPNDEHALVAGVGAGQGVFALRNDLGTPATSAPYVLVPYLNHNSLWQFRVFQVVSGGLQYPWTAGNLLQAPYPITALQTSPRNYPVSGPYWTDRKTNFWARAAGDNGGMTNIVMRYFYPMQSSFYFPSNSQPVLSADIPWLDFAAGTPGTPINVTFNISWPANVPQLQVGETLVTPKFGLPDISQQISAEIVYQQSQAQGQGSSVQLIDPTRIIQVSLASLPADVTTANNNGFVYFPTLPPQLRTNLFYDPVHHLLKLQGSFIQPAAGEYYLLLNVVTARTKAVLLSLSHDATFNAALNMLSSQASQVITVPPNTAFSHPLALSAGAAQGTGYVTLAFNNSTNLDLPADPISLAIIQVTNSLYIGELKVILSDNPFDEQLTLRHSGDFAGQADGYIFQWRTLRPNPDGTEPTNSPDSWYSYTPNPPTGQGALDITISGPGDFTLADNWFICRYHSTNVFGPCSTNWSAWTAPQLAEGWIKRVLAGINPFEQRISNFQNQTVNTTVSMISQAGAPWQGNVPLNQQAANSYGLIETYQTVLNRGLGLTVADDPDVNQALLLAAGRVSDLYMLLGNEAYADAADPTIAISTDDPTIGAEATSIHCFMDQTATLMEEELDLLRGRDGTLSPGTQVPPVYNRLFWNFTQSGDAGEVAYALNYNIQPQSGNVSGNITEADAAALYPQGHGDAWGHYLTAIKGYYDLLQSTNFTWVPRAEAVLIAGVPVSVNYFDERKFAKAAAARTLTGAQIVNLTYRNAYVEDPNGQWQGYVDSNTNRAWGLSEWGSRTGQAAFFDWVVGNAMLPALDPDGNHTGILKVDRTTVPELRQVAAGYLNIQSEVDKADAGLNPLGLVKNVVPFDIDPSLVTASPPQTHFEQIYNRAVSALNNCITVFNNAKACTQALRKQSDTLVTFQSTVANQEADFNNRLIEQFGYPYSDDIGPTGSYSQGYSGPDLYHYMYVDPSQLLGIAPPPFQTFTVQVHNTVVNPDGSLSKTTNNVVFHLSTNGYGLVKPSTWTGSRQAPGQIQMAQSDLLQAKARFEKAESDYQNLLSQIDDQASLLQSQYNINADEINILNTSLKTQETLNQAISQSQSRVLDFQTKGRQATLVANAVAEALPGVTGVIAGLADGVIDDFTSTIRSAILLAGTVTSEVMNEEANQESLSELDQQQAKEEAQSLTSLQLTTLHQEQPILQQVAQLQELIRQEVGSRLELYTMQEAMQQSAGKYASTLAAAQRIIEDRERFRQQTAAQVQTYRYKDMAFRIFRNDALQKYWAQFDLAATYVYLAAKAYDYETNLRPGDPLGPGEDFMTDIIRAQAIGLISGGQPEVGDGTGDAGLADPIARMYLNWNLVLKGRLGFNNPETETGQFSLRSELYRVQQGTQGKAAWQQVLSQCVVSNLFDIPEFQRYCIPFTPALPVEPGIAIPFSTTINFGQNFFAWPLGGGDHAYDSSHFATKIRSVGVWFANFNSLALSQTPYVYLIPIGSDVMRSPTGGQGITREWKIVDQALPVPFPITAANLSNPNWIPLDNGLSGTYNDIRKYGSFLAYNDSGSFNPGQTTSSSRLIGRSVWNTKWLLIIPAGTLSADRNEGIQRFINGSLVNGTRDGNGVSDIKIFFQTYSYSGN